MNPISRLALLAQLLREALGGSSTESLNKTQVQKLTYLAQEKGLQTGFEFRMHHYGPYSFDLEDALHLLERFGVVRSKLESHGTWAEYKLSLDDSAARGLVQSADETSQEQANIVNDVARLFGGRDRRALELLSTVHLVHSLLGRGAQQGPDLERVLQTVSDLKPHFAKDEIRAAYKELVEMDMLPQQPPDPAVDG